MGISRRHFFQLAGAGTGLLLQSQLLKGQEAPAAEAALKPEKSIVPNGEPVEIPVNRAKVALIQGDDRRKNVYEALMTIDDQIQAGLRRKKYVVIKPNFVSTSRQLAATNVDAISGVLDYLAPRYRGPIVIAEASARDTMDGYANFNYLALEKERKSQHVSLVDLNREGKYVTMPMLDYDLHETGVRLAARLTDPDAYIISCAMLKTHNSVVATLSVKNMTMGAPLHSVDNPNPWNDKHRYHVGARQHNFNLLLTAQKLQPYWGTAVIDGYEGMEGNGPTQGTPVDSRLAIASTDYIAADRVALETMGINPDWVGYLQFCGRSGLGQYDLTKIDIEGAKVASVQKKYKLHDAINRELLWMGPMEEVPPKTSKLDLQQELQPYLCA